MNRQNKEDIKMPYSVRVKKHLPSVAQRKPRIVTVKPVVKPVKKVLPTEKIPKSEGLNLRNVSRVSLHPSPSSTIPKPTQASVPSARILPQSVKTPSPLFIRYPRSIRSFKETVPPTLALMKRSWDSSFFSRPSSLV